MSHNHAPGTPCAATCPNRAANAARSTAMRCTSCGRINCPSITHQKEGAR